jgi:hypothetical protein
MSGPHAGMDDPMVGAVRGELRRIASTARTAAVEAANHAGASGMKSTSKAIATHPREMREALSKRLAARGRTEPDLVRWRGRSPDPSPARDSRVAAALRAVPQSRLARSLVTSAAAAYRLIKRAVGAKQPYERTVWLRARRGHFPFRNPRLGR